MPAPQRAPIDAHPGQESTPARQELPPSDTKSTKFVPAGDSAAERLIADLGKSKTPRARAKAWVAYVSDESGEFEAAAGEASALINAGAPDDVVAFVNGLATLEATQMARSAGLPRR